MNKSKSLIRLCCLLALVIAQELKAQEFGAHIGGNSSFFTPNFRLEAGHLGLVVGGFVNHDLSEVLQLTGGIDYSQLSGTINSNPETIGSLLVLKNNNITVHTFEASGLIGYKLPLDFLGDTSPFIQGGASIGYNAGTLNKYTARYVAAGSFQPIEVRGKENVQAVAEDFIAMWMVGLRFQSVLGDGLFSKMILDFRFKSSINNAIRPFTINNDPRELGIRSISMTLGFTF